MNALAQRNGSELAAFDDAHEVQGGSLQQFNAAGIDIQIATAHRYPRSVAKFLRESEDLVSANKHVAASCTYALPRGGKTITGPSVRLAEMLMSTWGNIRVSSMVTGDDGKFVTAQAIALDLQANVGISIEARRRVTDKHGRRYDDDMLAVASNAAISIALRNAVFRVIPRTYVDIIHDAAKAVAGGQLEDMDSTRAAWVAFFANKGVAERDLFRALGVVGQQDIGTDQIITLQGWQQSLKDNLITLEEIFAPPVEAAAAKVEGPTKSAKLANKLAESREPGSDG